MRDPDTECCWHCGGILKDRACLTHGKLYATYERVRLGAADYEDRARWQHGCTCATCSCSLNRGDRTTIEHNIAKIIRQREAATV
jgi:hypothetical protein